MPSMKRRRRSGKRASSSSSSGSKKPRVIKGRVNLRVAGYTGLQKIPPSALIQYLPANKLRAAAKKVLGKTGKKTKKRRAAKRRRRAGRK
jgi:hypothetical protein